MLPLQGFWGIVVWVLTIAILMALWLYVIPVYVWQYILLLRVPIVFGVFLFGFPILAKLPIASSLFQNLFAMRGRGQLATTMVSSTMAGLMVTDISAIILVNAPARFDLPPLPDWIEDPFIHSKILQYMLVTILIAPTWITAIRLSIAEITHKHKPVQGFALGIVGSLGLIALVNWAEFIIGSSQEARRVLSMVVLLFSKGHAEGYLKNSEPTYGHVLGFALGFVGFLVYSLVIILYQPRPKRILRILGEAPALLYIFLLIWIGTLLLGGATFYADYFHVPVIAFFVVFSGLIYGLYGVDHFFKIERVKEPSLSSNKPESLSDFKTAIANRVKDQKGERTLVVVCASGGGIQAAGWTVQVLAGLQKELGTSFTRAIGLISSASGGSVGSMYFLDQFEGGFPPEPSLDKIFTRATEDSLDAVGWGLAYPDLVRAIGLPFLVDKYSDRGAAMERNWQRHLTKPQATLADWREQILDGEIPIPVFNATLVEDGRRFLITPMSFIKDVEYPSSDEGGIDNDQKRARKAIDFNTLFFDTHQGIPYDLSVATAARLSATFPYVSPIARNDGDFKRNYHVADGGFFDNAGLFTAIEWLDEWLDVFSKDLSIKRVLLLQINAFPESNLKPEIPGDKGWWMELFGPLLALFGVRDSTQVARNLKEADLLQSRWKDEVEIKPYIVFFPNGSTSTLYNQPLSWKLTENQKQNLRDAWAELRIHPVIDDIKDLWRNKWNIP